MRKLSCIFVLLLLFCFSYLKGQVNPFSKFNEVPINKITPKGWLKQYLVNQRNGLTGYIENAGNPFNKDIWGEKFEKDPPGWWAYEQTAYWIDGALRTGYLLNDSYLLDRVHKYIYRVLDSPDSDGYLGPLHLKKMVKKRTDNSIVWFDDAAFSRWPHVVFFRAVMAECMVKNDKKLYSLLRNHYINSPYSYLGYREVLNIEPMLFAYLHIGDTSLVNFAERLYESYNKFYVKAKIYSGNLLKDAPCNEHGVTYNEISKLGAILYLATGKPEYLEISKKAYEKIDKYHMLIDGVNSSTEQMREVTPLESHETCDIADYTWAVGYLLMATGKAEYADKIERACLNAAPAAVKSDFKALQYFSSPNQVISTYNSNHNIFFRGNAAMAFAPKAFTECCTGDVNRIMPNYAARMWMSTPGKGIAAVMYAPSEINYIAGANNKPIQIIEETSYPFSDTVKFVFRADEAVEFPFTFRIPSWCTKPVVKYNDEVIGNLAQGEFSTIIRNFKNNDIITMIFPQEIKSVEAANGLAIERGPLVYALKIEEDWKVNPNAPNTTKDFPGYNLYAKSKWNYALSIDRGNLNKQAEISYRYNNNFPWTIENAPIEIKLKAQEIKNWDLVKPDSIQIEAWDYDSTKSRYIGKSKYNGGNIYEIANEAFYTPDLPSEEFIRNNVSGKTETITLVPYGCSKLRITIFPWLK